MRQRRARKDQAATAIALPEIGTLERIPMSLNTIVTRGLDPRVHLLRKKMDCRVKPGNDELSQCKRKML
jgi:hypothetical protein